MYYKKKLFIFLFFLVFMLIKMTISLENPDFKDYKLDVELKNKSNISIKSVFEEKIINGNISGRVYESGGKIFSNARMWCDILGRTYKGRGFSCGFAEVEDLKGYCQFTTSKPKDSLLTYWECSTTAGLNGDAICKGKVKVLQGFGNLAGVIGFGELEMPLIKNLTSQKISYPMQWKLKIKHPIVLKKQN